MESTKESRMAAAIKRQENLEKVNEDAPVHEPDPEKCIQCEWNDGKPRKIEFVPYKDRSGMSIYVYTDGLNTAAFGLTSKAALNLSRGIEKIIFGVPGFKEELEKSFEREGIDPS